MPEVNSYADVIRDWELLLIAVKEHAELLPSVEPYRFALEAHLAPTKDTKARQDSHTAGRQQATQDLKGMIAQGRELAIRLRGAIRADVGPKSERLVQFGVKPIRQRTRRAPVVDPPETKAPLPDPKPAA